MEQKIDILTFQPLLAEVRKASDVKHGLVTTRVFLQNQKTPCPVQTSDGSLPQATGSVRVTDDTGAVAMCLQ